MNGGVAQRLQARNQTLGGKTTKLLQTLIRWVNAVFLFAARRGLRYLRW